MNGDEHGYPGSLKLLLRNAGTPTLGGRPLIHFASAAASAWFACHSKKVWTSELVLIIAHYGGFPERIDFNSSCTDITKAAFNPTQIFGDDVTEEKGENARLSAFVGAIAVGDLVKSTLGPKGMDKILQSAWVLIL